MAKYITTYYTIKQARQRIDRRQTIIAFIILYGGAVIIATLETLDTGIAG